MPTLAPIRTFCDSISNGSSSVAMICCASRVPSPVAGCALQHGELVAAEARGEHAFTDAGAEPACDALEQQVAGGVAERVVDALEIVEVDVQEVQGLARAQLAQQEARALAELGAVGQAGEGVVIGELMDARLRFLMLHRDRAKVDALFDQHALQVRRAALRAVVEREGADHAAVACADRARPAGFQPRRQHVAVTGPQRIGRDVGDFDGLASPGGGAAGPRAGSDRDAFDRFLVVFGKARRGERMQATLHVDGEDGADRGWHDPLRRLADAAGDHLQWLAARDRHEGAALQSLQ